MEVKESEGNMEDMRKTWENEHRRGKIFGGMLIVVGGCLYLMKELGVIFPDWLLTWKTGLIALGLLIGVKHKFKNPGWIIVSLIGAAFLLNDVYPDMHIKPLIWPLVIILIGLVIIFKPHRRNQHHYWRRHRRHWKHYHKHHGAYNNFSGTTQTINDDYIDSTVFMGSVQKNIISKEFRGGDITVVFGGTELNLSQADFTGQISLEVTQAFGGTTLIIPPTWEIKSEIVAVMASVEDKRPVRPVTDAGQAKVLVLRGNIFMGGMDIKSY